MKANINEMEFSDIERMLDGITEDKILEVLNALVSVCRDNRAKDCDCKYICTILKKSVMDIDLHNTSLKYQ